MRNLRQPRTSALLTFAFCRTLETHRPTDSAVNGPHPQGSSNRPSPELAIAVGGSGSASPYPRNKSAPKNMLGEEFSKSYLE
jgi:hypothetical protein